MRLTFVQLGTYVADARRLGLTDEDQRVLEEMLLETPTAGSVMPGTGGVRKLRYAPMRSSGGKRGGVRICYAWFPAFAHLYFIVAFGKNEQANLTARQKAEIRTLLREVQRYLDGGRR